MPAKPRRSCAKPRCSRAESLCGHAKAFREGTKPFCGWISAFRPEDRLDGADKQEVNDFTRKSDSTLATIAGTASAILLSQPAYGVGDATAEALEEAGLQLSLSISTAQTAADAAKAATLAKATRRENALVALTNVSNVVYTNGTSDSMIQALGFTPRATPTRPVAPTVVTGLTVRPLPDGMLRLEFKRTGNRPSAIFQIERSFDSGATWSIVASTQGTRLNLSGYAPGVPVLFRVTTTNSVGTSLPSTVVGAYVGESEAEEDAAELKLAA